MRGEIFGIAGRSGSGKSVLMRAILGLVDIKSGIIYIRTTKENPLATAHTYGVLFQQGALFSSLTALDNIKLPMIEHMDCSESLITELAYLKLRLVGLFHDTANKYPHELSVGMTKRVALARALALDPEIVFLDEPTAGLDPLSAQKFDDLIVTLRDTLKLTVFMVTHDFASLHATCDKLAIIDSNRALIHGSKEQMLALYYPWIDSYYTKGSNST